MIRVAEDIIYIYKEISREILRQNWQDLVNKERLEIKRVKVEKHNAGHLDFEVSVRNPNVLKAAGYLYLKIKNVGWSAWYRW